MIADAPHYVSRRKENGADVRIEQGDEVLEFFQTNLQP